MYFPPLGKDPTLSEEARMNVTVRRDAKEYEKKKNLSFSQSVAHTRYHEIHKAEASTNNGEQH